MEKKITLPDGQVLVKRNELIDQLYDVVERLLKEKDHIEKEIDVTMAKIGKTEALSEDIKNMDAACVLEERCAGLIEQLHHMEMSLFKLCSKLATGWLSYEHIEESDRRVEALKKAGDYEGAGAILRSAYHGQELKCAMEIMTAVSVVAADTEDAIRRYLRRQAALLDILDEEEGQAELVFNIHDEMMGLADRYHINW